MNRSPSSRSRCQTATQTLSSHGEEHLFSRAASLSLPRRFSASASWLPLSIHPPKRGAGGAPTGALFCYVARARRDDRVSETRAVPLQPGRPLGAPSWRFSAGDPRCRLRQWHRSRPATCPRQVKCLTGGVPDLPRCGSRRNRGTPLPAPSSGSSPEDAPSERGCETYTINPLRSHALSSRRSHKNVPDTTGRHARAWPAHPSFRPCASLRAVAIN